MAASEVCFIAQPVAEGVADQHEGQARGKAQRQHHQHLGRKIIAELIAPARRNTHAATICEPSSSGNSVRNISSSSAGSTGLVRKPSIPASRQARLPVFQRIGGQGHDGRAGALLARLLGADGLGGLDAVHAGHVDVGEQKIELALGHGLDRVIAGGDFGDAVAAAAQQLADQHHVDGIVLGQKDMQAVTGGHAAVVPERRGAARPCKRCAPGRDDLPGRARGSRADQIPRPVRSRRQ